MVNKYFKVVKKEGPPQPKTQVMDYEKERQGGGIPPLITRKSNTIIFNSMGRNGDHVQISLCLCFFCIRSNTKCLV